MVHSATYALSKAVDAIANIGFRKNPCFMCVLIIDCCLCLIATITEVNSRK